MPKIYCIYRIRYNDRQLFVYVTNNVSRKFPVVFPSPTLICSKIFWSVDAMDAKFCIKGACLSSCLPQFVFEFFSGGFPAEEPDPESNISIPIDFLVRARCMNLTSLLNLTFVRNSQAGKGNPAVQQVIDDSGSFVSTSILKRSASLTLFE